MGIFTIISQEEIDDAMQRAVFELYTIPMTLEQLLRYANNLSGMFGIEIVCHSSEFNGDSYPSVIGPLNDDFEVIKAIK